MTCWVGFSLMQACEWIKALQCYVISLLCLTSPDICLLWFPLHSTELLWLGSSWYCCRVWNKVLFWCVCSTAVMMVCYWDAYSQICLALITSLLQLLASGSQHGRWHMVLANMQVCIWFIIYVSSWFMNWLNKDVGLCLQVAFSFWCSRSAVLLQDGV